MEVGKGQALTERLNGIRKFFRDSFIFLCCLKKIFFPPSWMEKGTLLFSHLTYVNGARENALWSPVPQAVWGTMISQESTGQWVESPARGYAVI